jgi:hypothetical protein
LAGKQLLERLGVEEEYNVAPIWNTNFKVLKSIVGEDILSKIKFLKSSFGKEHING